MTEAEFMSLPYGAIVQGPKGRYVVLGHAERDDELILRQFHEWLGKPVSKSAAADFEVISGLMSGWEPTP